MATLAPRYLRVVVTARCTLKCTYCHMEGDPDTGRGPLSVDELFAAIDLAARNGVTKVKFLGGEPLLRKDLPQLVGRLREAWPDLDLSVITGGAVDPARVDAVFEAGLSRMNVSIHGFELAAFARRGGTPRSLSLRTELIDRVLAWGRPTKLNYVYGSGDDIRDLGHLLDWAAPRGLVVNVLDDLSRSDLGPHEVVNVVTTLRGDPDRVWTEPDDASLDTMRLGWSDGLIVEVKHQQLGVVAPWASCVGCPVRHRCREGIHAVRLTHDGVLRPCMDRPDLGLALRPLLGTESATAAWDAWMVTQ